MIEIGHRTEQIIKELTQQKTNQWQTQEDAATSQSNALELQNQWDLPTKEFREDIADGRVPRPDSDLSTLPDHTLEDAAERTRQEETQRDAEETNTGRWCKVKELN